MNCIFCQAITTVIHEEYGSEHAFDSYLEWTTYRCEYCRVEINFYHRTGQITDYTIITDKYRAEFLLTDNVFCLMDHDRQKIILELGFIPINITPQNISDKLKMYLTFS
jgi:hypothetical protein